MPGGPWLRSTYPHRGPRLGGPVRVQKSAPSLTGEARLLDAVVVIKFGPQIPIPRPMPQSFTQSAGRTLPPEMLAPTNDLRVGGPNDLCGRHTQIIGRYDRDGSDGTELTVTATAGGIQDGAKGYENGTPSIRQKRSASTVQPGSSTDGRAWSVSRRQPRRRQGVRLLDRYQYFLISG